MIKTFDRRKHVPVIQGTTAKSCRHCSRWFAAPPRFTNCYDCMATPCDRDRLEAKLRELAGTVKPKAVDSVEFDQFNPDPMVAAAFLDLSAKYPRTFKNFAGLVDCGKLSQIHSKASAA